MSRINEFTEAGRVEIKEPDFRPFELLQEGGQGTDAQKRMQDSYEQGRLALQAGDTKKAEKLFKAGLDAAKPLSKEAHLLNNAAGLACENGKDWAEAQKYYREALKCSKALIGNRDGSTIASDLSDIARMDGRQGKLEEADKGFREAERMFEKFDPKDLPVRYRAAFVRSYTEHIHLLYVKGDPEGAAEVSMKGDLLRRLLEQPKAAPKRKKET
jgi:tetratricopeptide (TPR) repeat protein